MTEAYLAPERSRVQTLAEEYRGRGYDVAVEPPSHNLPDFLSGYRPDLIVTRDGETTVIEVKSRRTLAAESQSREIARLLKGRAGWSFELVIVSGEPAPSPPNSVSFDLADVKRTLGEARNLVASGFTGPAFLSGWGALEATLRLLLKSEGVDPRSFASAQLLKQGVEEGLISKEDYRTLSSLMMQRNALAHGFQNDAINSALVSKLLDVAERLLTEPTSHQSA